MRICLVPQCYHRSSADQESRIKQQQPPPAVVVSSAAAFLIHRARAVLKLAPFASNLSLSLSLSDSIQFDGPRCCPRRSATVVPLETPLLLLLLVLRDAVDDGSRAPSSRSSDPAWNYFQLFYLFSFRRLFSFCRTKRAQPRWRTGELRKEWLLFYYSVNCWNQLDAFFYALGLTRW